MPNLSQNASAVLDLVNIPLSGSILYPNIIGKTYRIINQVNRMMMREARLSDQNQYLKFLTLPSPTKEKSIPSIPDPNSICTVELLSDSATDQRVDVQIVGRLELNAQEGRGAKACARFGRPTTIRFTWNPSENGDTLYIGYENLPTDATLPGDFPNLPESHHDCLIYRSAALVKETVMGQEMGQVFLETMEKIEKQWEKWCRRESEERPMQRPGFGSLDMNVDYWGWYA